MGNNQITHKNSNKLHTPTIILSKAVRGLSLRYLQLQPVGAMTGPSRRFSRVLTRGYYGSPAGCHRPSPRVLGSPPGRYTHQGAQVPDADVTGHHPGFSGPLPGAIHTRGPKSLVRMSKAITQGSRVPAQLKVTPEGATPLVKMVSASPGVSGPLPGTVHTRGAQVPWWAHCSQKRNELLAHLGGCKGPLPGETASQI